MLAAIRCSAAIGGGLVPVPAGHVHLRQAAFQGSFALEGEDISIEETQLIVLDGVLEATLSGPVAGRLTVTAVVSGESTTPAHGVGPHAGQHPKLTYEERPATPGNPNPEIFDLSGVVSHLL